MYRAINKKQFSKIIERNESSFTYKQDYDEFIREYTEQGWQNNGVGIDTLNKVEEFCDFYNNNNNDEDEAYASLCIAKIAGILTPLITFNKDCEEYKVLKSTGIYDVFESPDGGVDIGNVYIVIAHFLEKQGDDEYSIEYGYGLDSIATVEALNYMTMEICDILPNSNFANICSINKQTKRLYIKGFYKQYQSPSKTN